MNVLPIVGDDMPRKKYDGPGQPPKWKSAAQLQKLIDEYYAICESKEKPMTIAGLGVHLGVNRQTIYNYSYKDDFFDTIQKARDKILAYYEEQAIVRGSAGTIFLMKNYGYTDRTEIGLDSNKEAVEAIKAMGDVLESN